MTLVVSKEEFKEAEEANQRKELKKVLNSVSIVLGQMPLKDEKLTVAINKLVLKLDEIKGIEFPELPEPKINVEVNNDKVTSSIEKLGVDLLVELRKYNERPIPDEFIIEKDNFGILKKIKIKYK